jgi:hypothetical protein
MTKATMLVCFTIMFIIIQLVRGASIDTIGNKGDSRRQVFNLFASLMGEEQVELPEIDWNTIESKKTFKPRVKELEIDQNGLFEKVKDCVKKCLEQINPDKLYRDTCIAKSCDIF